MKTKKVKITRVLANNIISLRLAHKMSASELARQIGVTRQAIYNIENESSWVSLEKIEALAKVFGIEQHELFQNNTGQQKDKEM